jgi:hypothetical protein
MQSWDSCSRRCRRASIACIWLMLGSIDDAVDARQHKNKRRWSTLKQVAWISLISYFSDAVSCLTVTRCSPDVPIDSGCCFSQSTRSIGCQLFWAIEDYAATGQFQVSNPIGQPRDHDEGDANRSTVGAVVGTRACWRLFAKRKIGYLL